ncbi:MAG: 4-hydroxythreonine-4-phosphate dehydrogenase PdxA [Rhodothermaceae bacterium]|nr:4-hydroxythreonine-4-phosphate dehydrogenase PdxA [Rhodothermaceae bacterium]
MGLSSLRSSDQRPVLAITSGDPNGIGPEVALKALADPAVQVRIHPVLVGSVAVWDWWAKELGLVDVMRDFEMREANGSLPPTVEPGRITAEGGRAAMHAVEAAADGCLAGTYNGMVTAPISKEAIRLADYAFPGHTEFLAARTGAERVVMLLVSGDLRVGLVTIHVPISAVPGLITGERIIETLTTVNAALRRDFGIAEPRIAVLGLNPHAGDGGVIGREDMEVVVPALEAATARGFSVAGPFAADGFFGQRADRQFDAVVAMYHDQGLAPFKALAMGAGVNVTGGLPIVRTSPDHGTAFAIAGQGLARAHSMRAAILLAAEIAERRMQEAEVS